MNILTAILLYLLVINIIAFIVFGVDKYKAQHNRWRIPEATLLTISALGGSIGAWCGMKLWHHKTMHLKFKYGVPLLFIFQVALTVFILTKH